MNMKYYMSTNLVSEKTTQPHYITEIVENLLTELQNGKLVAGIYLDLSKAFDTVDHNILLDKL